MPTPITFSVAAASRQGTFQTSTLTMPAGYTNLFYQLAIPLTADYENTANSYTSIIMIDSAGGSNFSLYEEATWSGGPATDKNGVVDPPPGISVNVSQIPVGSSVIVRVTVPLAMTIGIENGVLS